MWDDINTYAVSHSKCPRCLAGPGQWCMTSSNKVARYLHSGRVWPWQEIWAKGYQAGEKDAQYMFDQGRRR